MTKVDFAYMPEAHSILAHIRRTAMAKIMPAEIFET
ncbi:uncharacterized protein METZ01_LOCUS190043 [marine metagenome]|jgi:hypothetical protein|uniref:Uncharacterized protein n=1 Tax=marine metagenome TaxID=408172 RepID=A0A382DGC7_9ZZZZ